MELGVKAVAVAGSGIPRIIGKVKAAGLLEPEFIGDELDQSQKLWKMVAENPTATQAQYADQLRRET